MRRPYGNPEQVVEFIERTGVDLFAPAIGTAHGVYKTKDPKIDFERMGRISKMVNGDKVQTPLVVHGGTGLSEDYIARLIEVGGSKFNVSTELKYVLIDTTYNYISNCRDEYEPGKVDAAVLRCNPPGSRPVDGYFRKLWKGLGVSAIYCNTS
jgi:tagatose 1,6-diphosphate aldolase GatY/KbaY